jgi:hypothetical protein
MAIEIDEQYTKVKCDMCDRIIEKRVRYYYEKPNVVLASKDVCKECSFNVRMK